MPTVNAGVANVDYQLGFVKDGHVQLFAGCLPGDDDGFIVTICTCAGATTRVRTTTTLVLYRVG